MKSVILFAALFLSTYATPLKALQCMAVALHDTHAVEDPAAVWKSGKQDGPVTEYEVDDKTKAGAFCIHGGYCYLAYVTINGQSVEALRLTNCRIKPGSGTHADGETDYELEAVPARAAAPAESGSVQDMKAIRGIAGRRASLWMVLRPKTLPIAQGAFTAMERRCFSWTIRTRSSPSDS